MNERITRMKSALRISKYPLCVEMFRLANESLVQTAEDSMLLRRAKLHAHILDNITIFIEPEDLLCGSGASKPFGLEMQYEYGVWTPDEVESLKSEMVILSRIWEIGRASCRERVYHSRKSPHSTGYSHPWFRHTPYLPDESFR